MKVASGKEFIQSHYQSSLISSFASMKLDQFLKWMGWVSTGGEAKHLIRSGKVSVNGIIERRRGRQLKTGDTIKFETYEAMMPDNGAITT